jgi:hypothetical protein
MDMKARKTKTGSGKSFRSCIRPLEWVESHVPISVRQIGPAMIAHRFWIDPNTYKPLYSNITQIR